MSGVQEYGVFVNLEPGVDGLMKLPSPKVGMVHKGDQVLIDIHEISNKDKQIRGVILKKI
ncbi:hypothetical protein EIZ39_18195 [Ammoniphilus sp. CFH 90114]|nr:hypothetical protein EIZ39_18195 [Ammoniphilus sp. CFH 90114]